MRISVTLTEQYTRRQVSGLVARASGDSGGETSTMSDNHEQRRRKLADLRGGNPDDVLTEYEKLYANIGELDDLILQEMM